MPNISVPLWMMQGKGIRLPISLSYHASGVKVDEMAPPMGLNAGGVVTRVMMGLADDSFGGYLNNATPVPDQFTSYGQFEEYANGSADSQPDIFHFSLPGASGKFVLNHDGTVMLMPIQKVDVRYDKTAGGEISRWVITTADGVTYTLDQNERSKNTALDLSIGNAAPTEFYNSSWFLSTIETPQGETINFTYRDYEITYRLQDSETRYTQFYQSGSCAVRPQDQKFKITTLIRGKRLTSIQVMSSDETVRLYYEQPRYDLAQDSALTRIEVKNMLGRTVKEFALDYQYLQNALLVTLPEGTTPDELTLRLMLTSITEFQGGLSKPPYAFEYITENAGRSLPPRLSKAQDHWGYFNNQRTNTTLCPYQNVTQLVNGQEITFEALGGIRSPDGSSSVIGTLNKITYPTGGHTQLDYETHDYYQTGATELVPKSWLYSIANEFESSDKTFTIGPDIEGRVRVNFTYSEEFTSDPSLVWMRINLVGSDASVPPVYYSEAYYDPNSKTFQEAALDLVPGDYQITYQGIDRTVMEPGHIYDLKVNWLEELTSEEKMPAGGVRIRQTTAYDPVTANTIVKHYRYVREDEKSSGSMVSTPEYGYVMEMQKGGDCFSGGQPSVGLIWVRSPAPNYTLGMTQGSYVGYSRVEVVEGEHEENGRTVYKYTSPASHPDMLDSDQWPAAPNDTREWQRGLLEGVAQYGGNASDPLSQSDTRYAFYTYGSNNPNALNRYVQAAKVVSTCVADCPINVNDPSTFQINFYKIGTGYNEANQTIETLKSQAGSPITTETNYEYSLAHLRLSKKEFNNSKNQTRTTSYKYATDFTNNTYGSQTLRDKHMHSQVLEQTTSVDGSPIRRVTTTYNETTTGHVVPIFVANYPTGSGSALETNYTYDDYGNVKQVLSVDGIFISYIWGYNHTLPVAQVVGANYTSAVAEVNLEALQSLDGQELRDELDKLRTLPNALVTTYTYDPLTGITSQTDPSKLTTHYEYDDLGRLKVVKDYQQDKLSEYQYRYRPRE